MSTVGWIAVAVWVVGGLPVAVIVAPYVDGGDLVADDALYGFVIVCMWMFAPLVVAAALGAVVCAGIGRVAYRVSGALS